MSKRYTIQEDENRIHLVGKVQGMFAKGWALCGGLSVYVKNQSTVMYAQALTKEFSDD